MDVFMFQADLLCSDCGKKVREELTEAGKAPTHPEDEVTYDSDEFPKGPYANGGGEADSPRHCGQCGRFLENQLTEDGWHYLEETAAEYLFDGSGDRETIMEWLNFYASASGFTLQRK